MITLLASAARTASGTDALANLPHPELLESAVFELVVSVAATEAGDTLDVYVQHSIDGGTTYDDVVHFTQVLGNGGAKKFTAEWRADVLPDSELHAPADASLAAGVLQGPKGATWRLKWVIVDANANVNQSFTFAVHAQVRRRR